MRIHTGISCIFLFFSGFVQSGSWEIEAGGFYSHTDTKINAYDPYLDKTRTIDFESDLQLDDNAVLPYIELEYNFNQKHSVYLDWRSLHRKATRSAITKPFEFTSDGTTYLIQLGSTVTTTLDIDLARIGYGYQFYDNHDLKIDALAGFHVMWLTFGFSGQLGAKIEGTDQIPSTFISDSIFSDVTAPLPNFGLQSEYLLSKDWTLVSHAQAFYLTIDDFKGWLYEIDLGLKYTLSDNFNLSGSLNYYELGVDYDDGATVVDMTYKFYGPMITLAYEF